MKNPFKLLEILLTNWAWASRENLIIKSAWLAHKIAPDDFTARTIHALLVHSGDWRAAADWLESSQRQPRERVDKFRKWATKLNAPSNRGLLLEWKGGAL